MSGRQVGLRASLNALENRIFHPCQEYNHKSSVLQPIPHHNLSEYVSNVRQLDLVGSAEYSILVFCFT